MRSTKVRLYLETRLEKGLEIACTRAHANYLLNVLHLGDGAQILVFDGGTGEWRAVIARRTTDACALHIKQQVRGQEEGPDIHYLFAPLKPEQLDHMVQKATELGVAALRPVVTHRTDAQHLKPGRMRCNVIEAAEQCGVLGLPVVHEPESLEKILENWDPSRHIIYCDEEAPVASPLKALGQLNPGPLAVLVGPQGGFDAGERARLQGFDHVTAISLGPRVMRADTAAVAALALVNAVLGDWQ